MNDLKSRKGTNVSHALFEGECPFRKRISYKKTLHLYRQPEQHNVYQQDT